MNIPYTKDQLFRANAKLMEENRALKNDLKEINQCIDDFYTKEEPRRLHDAPLSAFSGQIQVIDKVSSLKDK
ncbi:hypothetical protein KM908_20335 [Alkalihalobacillus clausii]|jgi:hypothetical protein|uniref:hypothetical protein n=1 Tax=Shouchella clausii TaxID=79880 RepID=UPI001C24F0B1|nr:hypothetical protein [Shouchella clausii]MBU8598463.1 hypothetical protein [Shouchella clausii]